MHRDPVPSVYAENMTVEIVDTVELSNCIMQTEKVKHGDAASDEQPTVLAVCYTKCENHFYLGNLKHAQFLTDEMGITEQLQPVPNGKTVAVGFNPETQQWFGWSHRATGAFTIGSEVVKGDNAFVPRNREEFEESCKAFWDIGKRMETVPGFHLTREFVAFRHDQIDPDVSTEFPIAVLVYEENYEPHRPDHLKDSSPLREMPIMYPLVWGRGEWKAETLEDAKQMAIDFANGVG